MADNFPLTPGAGRKAATDDVSYSGEAADVQLMRLVGVTGSEGAKTVIDPPVHFNGTAQTATWDDATAQDATLAVTSLGYAGAFLEFTGDGGGASVGTIEFQGSFDGGTTWRPLMGSDVGAQGGVLALTIEVPAYSGLTMVFYIPSHGATHLRIKLVVAITGNETLTLRMVPTTVPLADLMGLTQLSRLPDILTSLQTMDDWDESDRAKVNPIVGQVGVQGGSGAVSALTQRVVLATDVALPAGSNAIGKLSANSGVDIGDVDVTTVPADPFGVNADAASATGSISAKLRFIAATGIPITSSALPSGASTLTEQQSQTAHLATIAGDTTDIEAAVELIDDTIKVDDAGFTVATDKVAMQGALAVAIGADPDAADANDAAAPIANRHRVQFVIGGHPNVLTLKHANITTAVTDTAIITQGSGGKICVTRLTVTLDNASTVFPTVLIGFGTTTTPTTTGVIAAHGGVPAGGGFTIGDGSGVIGQGTDDQDLRITTTGNATGNGLQVTVTYFVLPT